MANINPYNPNPVEQVVGTPGVDQSAGRAEAALAQGASAVQADLAQNTAQNSGLLGGIIGVGLHALGSIVAKHQANIAQQKSQLANLGVTNDGHSFGQMAGDLYRDLQKQHINDPENIETDLKQKLAAEKKQRLAKYSDPVLRAKAENEFDQHITSYSNKAGDWSLDTQTAQAKAMIPNMVASTTASIAQQKGPLQDRLNNFQDQWTNLQNTIRKTEPQLGKAYVDAALAEAHRNLSDTFFQNRITERPEDPTDALKDLNATKAILRGSVEMGFDLTVDDKQKLSGRIEAAERSELHSYDLSLQQKRSSFALGAEEMKNKLIASFTDPETQQNAINWAQDSTKQLKAFAEADEKDPLLTEEAKSIAREHYTAQFKQVDTILQTAHANQKYQDTLRRAAEAERRREISDAKHLRIEAERAHREFLTQKRNEAKDTLAITSDEAKAKLNSMLDEIGAADPTDRDKIVKLNAQIANFASLAQQADFITSDYAKDRISSANRIAEQAMLIKKDSFFGTGLFPSFSKLSMAGNTKEVLERNAKLKEDVQKAQGDMKSFKFIDSSVEAVPLEKRAQYLQSARNIINSENLKDIDKRLRLQQLRDRYTH